MKLGFGRFAVLGLLLTAAPVLAETPAAKKRERCEVQTGTPRRYMQSQCPDSGQAMVGLRSIDPIQILCAEIIVNCSDNPPAPEYRWVFVDGSNHWTGRCTAQHNDGDPSGQPCTNPGAKTTWIYAWAQGGCAPNYAEYENSYICQ